MGFIRDAFGRVSIEARSESFIVHPGYGYDETGNEPTNLVPVNGGLEVRESFARRWREDGHPEFTYDSLDDLIAALIDLRADREGVERTYALVPITALTTAALGFEDGSAWSVAFAAAARGERVDWPEVQ